jgi:prefoldin subunit 5
MADFAENFKEKNEQYKFLQDRIDQLTGRVQALNDEYSKLNVKND